MPALRASAAQRSARRRRDAIRVLMASVSVTLVLAAVTHAAAAWALQDLGRRSRCGVLRALGVGANAPGRTRREGALHAGAAGARARVAAQRLVVAVEVDRRAEISAVGARAPRDVRGEASSARDHDLGGAQGDQACAASIRATHRAEYDSAEALAREARDHLAQADAALVGHPDVRTSGPLHDAKKELAEAWCTLALVRDDPLPSPEDLAVDVAPYCNGLAEAASELRRQLLDRLRAGELARAEELMSAMDEIYSLLVTIDYPDGVTGGLRRTTDALRAVLERTRGDLTTAMVAARLQGAIEQAQGAAGRE